jgi:hypothetical protein
MPAKANLEGPDTANLLLKKHFDSFPSGMWGYQIEGIDVCSPMDIHANLTLNQTLQQDSAIRGFEIITGYVPDELPPEIGPEAIAEEDDEDDENDPVLESVALDKQIHKDAATSERNNHPMPTDLQKKAGNYRKAHIVLHALNISIENPEGSERAGVDPNGKRWSVIMPAHYGYVKKTMGADGDHFDVYIGPDTKSERVFIIDQLDADTGAFDECKGFLGCNDAEQARELYIKGFSDGRGKDRIGAITELSIQAFKAWLKNGDTTKPVCNAILESAQGGMKIDTDNGETTVDSILSRIARARAGSPKENLYLSAAREDRIHLLERAILRLPPGAYTLSIAGRNPLKDVIESIYGVFAGQDVTERLVRGMAVKYPKEIQAYFTLGLQEIIIKGRVKSKAVLESGLDVFGEEIPEGAWVGVDLDGTLANYEGWNDGQIGNPVPLMLDLVKKMIADGITVKIFTARAADPKMIPPIKAWCTENGLPDLEVTNEKDPDMIKLYDDRAVKVIPNHGVILESAGSWKDTIMRARSFDEIQFVFAELFPGVIKKEIWQMTREEFLASNTQQADDLSSFHEKVVTEAWEQGRTVPAEVLKDYPELLHRIFLKLMDYVKNYDLVLEDAAGESDEDLKIRAFLEGISPTDIQALKLGSHEEYYKFLVDLVAKLFSGDEELSFREDENGEHDYEHLLSDDTRKLYLHTMGSTISDHDISIDSIELGREKSILIKKYFDSEVQHDIWDLVIIKDKQIRTKIVRRGKKGAGYVRRVLLTK